MILCSPQNSALLKQSFCKYIKYLNIYLKEQNPECILGHNRDLLHIFLLQAEANAHRKEAPSPQWLNLTEQSALVRAQKPIVHTLPVSGSVDFPQVQLDMAANDPAMKWGHSDVSVAIDVAASHVRYSTLTPLLFQSYWDFNKFCLLSVSSICSTV